MDNLVYTTQQWLNLNYGDNSYYTVIDDDGVTGWGTMKALITALQIELGIDKPNGTFGPATRAAFRNLSITTTPLDDTVESEVSLQNQLFILQGALYCKGYSGGFTGKVNKATKEAVQNFQKDAGLRNADGVVTATIMKALLCMDAFKLLDYGEYNGDSQIRVIQQNLNRDYISNTNFQEDIGLVPCDGIYGRSTNKALLYALQIEEGIATPNGVFGPQTKSLCPVLSVGNTKKKFNYLLQYALYCNGYNPNGFDGLYGNGVKNAVTNFQSFCCLDADGIAGMKTWASLLVSTGDNSRKGIACDCSTTITDEKAKVLKNNNYSLVGRYLTGKYKITRQELEIIYANGLKVIPIMEQYGYYKEHFTEENGVKDALDAICSASTNGIAPNTVIYFAVDYDVISTEIESHIEKYFIGVKRVFENENINNYQIGIYAPRFVCQRMSEMGYTSRSFVCDMSTGFSGNLGYSLPKDWAFDQISTVKIPYNNTFIEIDNNIASSRATSSDYLVNVDTSEEEIVSIANSKSFAKKLGIEFSGVGTIQLLSTPNISMSLSLGYKSSVVSDGYETIQIENGQIDAVGYSSLLTDIQTAIGQDSCVELSNCLEIFDDMNVTAKVKAGTDKVIIETEEEIVINDSLSMIERLTVEIKNDCNKTAGENAEILINNVKNALVTVKGVSINIGTILLKILVVLLCAVVIILAVSIVGIISLEGAIVLSLGVLIGFCFVKLIKKDNESK